MAETYNDYPKAASNNAKRALKWRDENDNPNDCGTLVGWQRANQLANGEGISEETINRMASFNRHRQNKDVPYEEGCGGLMWDAWGGTEGIDWAINKAEKLREEKAMNNSVSINLFDDVDNYSIDLNLLAQTLTQAGGENIEFNIASDGGEVFAGLKAAALIEAYEGKTTSNIHGLAASIATALALSADEVLISKYAFFMIHNAWGLFGGNKEQVKKDLDTLKVIDNMLATIYTDKTQKNDKLIDGDYDKTLDYYKNLMKKETFIPAAKAIEMGLVDGYIQNANINVEQAANIANQRSLFFNKIPNKTMENKEKKGLFKAIAAAFGFTKDSAVEALAEEVEIKAEAETEIQNKEHYKEEEKEEKKGGSDKKKDEDDDEKEKMRKRMKAMEEEKKAMEEKLKAMEEKLKAMEEDKKAMEEKKAKLESDIANSASYNTTEDKEGLKEDKDSKTFFSSDVRNKLNNAFKFRK